MIVLFSAKNLTRSLASLISLVFLSTNVLFGHTPEASVWSERKKSKQTQIAALPINSFLPHLSALPAAAGGALAKAEGTGNRKFPLQNLDVNALLAHVTVRETHMFDKNNPIILIQDIHGNLEAQTHISKLIKSFGELKGSVPVTVGLEGAYGEFVYDLYKKLPDQKTASLIADAFFQSSRISGPAHAGFTFYNKKGTRALRFWGVDDPTLYRSNVDAYKAASKLKPKVEGRIKSIHKKLAKKKSRTFNKDLKEFDAQVEKYRQGELPFGEYAKLLSKYSPSSLNLSRFLKALDIEMVLHFPLVETERAAVIEKLTRQASQHDLDSLVRLSLAYQQGSLSFGGYYEHLKNLCRKNGIDLSKTPHFNAYIRYALLADQINADQLLAELQEVEKSVLDKLAVTQEEKRLVQESRRLYLADRLAQFGLTPEEWEEYKAKVRRQKPEDRINNKSSSILTPDSWLLAPFEQFYELADLRNEKMVENLLQIRGADLSLLVAGGFHTRGLTLLFKEKGLSYIVVTPKLTKVDTASGTQYLSVFDQEKTRLEVLLSGKRLFLTGVPAGARHSPDPRVPDPTDMMVLHNLAVDAADGNIHPQTRSVARLFLGRMVDSLLILKQKGQAAILQLKDSNRIFRAYVGDVRDLFTRLLWNRQADERFGSYRSRVFSFPRPMSGAQRLFREMLFSKRTLIALGVIVTLVLIGRLVNWDTSGYAKLATVIAIPFGKWRNALSLHDHDINLATLLDNEIVRQGSTLNLVPSMSHSLRHLLVPQMLPFHRRAGLKIKEMAEERWLQVFQEAFSQTFPDKGDIWDHYGVLVEPHSGSQANQTVDHAVLEAGDRVMGLRLDHGGHLTHGHPLNFSGAFFEIGPKPMVTGTSNGYAVDRKTGALDYDKLEQQALEFLPRKIVAGGTAFAHTWDWERLREIADKVSAKAGHYVILHADIAHISAQISVGHQMCPFGYADFVTLTTQKAGGPRGAILYGRKQAVLEINRRKSRPEEATLHELVQQAISPGIQEEPLWNAIAAKAAFAQYMMSPDYKAYAKRLRPLMRAFFDEAQKLGMKFSTEEAHNHLALVDTFSTYGLYGEEAERALERLDVGNILQGFSANRNTIPLDDQEQALLRKGDPGKQTPLHPFGIRLGMPSLASREFTEDEVRLVAQLMHETLANVQVMKREENNKVVRDLKIKDKSVVNRVKEQIDRLTRAHPLPADRVYTELLRGNIATAWQLLKLKDRELALQLMYLLQEQSGRITAAPTASEPPPYVAVQAAHPSSDVYAEGAADGRPGRERFYPMNGINDKTEMLARKRWEDLFGVSGPYEANVQAHSHAQALQAALMAVANPNDRVLVLHSEDDLSYPTHSDPNSFIRTYYKTEIRKTKNVKAALGKTLAHFDAFDGPPRVIVYDPSQIDPEILWNQVRHVFGDEVILIADVGTATLPLLGGTVSSPFGNADIVLLDTKSAGGLSGGVLFSCKEKLAWLNEHKKAPKSYTVADLVHRAMIPGMEGGPLLHFIASKAAQAKWLAEHGKELAKKVRKHMEQFERTYNEHWSDGFRYRLTPRSQGTWVSVDLSSKRMTRAKAEAALASIGIDVSDDTLWLNPDEYGVDIGIQNLTLRGFHHHDISAFAGIVVFALKAADPNTGEIPRPTRRDLAVRVQALAQKYPAQQEFLDQIHLAEVARPIDLYPYKDILREMGLDPYVRVGIPTAAAEKSMSLINGPAWYERGVAPAWESIVLGFFATALTVFLIFPFLNPDLHVPAFMAGLFFFLTTLFGGSFIAVFGFAALHDEERELGLAPLLAHMTASLAALGWMAFSFLGYHDPLTTLGWLYDKFPTAALFIQQFPQPALVTLLLEAGVAYTVAHTIYHYIHNNVVKKKNRMSVRRNNEKNELKIDEAIEIYDLLEKIRYLSFDLGSDIYGATKDAKQVIAHGYSIFNWLTQLEKNMEREIQLIRRLIRIAGEKGADLSMRRNFIARLHDDLKRESPFSRESIVRAIVSETDAHASELHTPQYWQNELEKFREKAETLLATAKKLKKYFPRRGQPSDLKTSMYLIMNEAGALKTNLANPLPPLPQRLSTDHFIEWVRSGWLGTAQARWDLILALIPSIMDKAYEWQKKLKTQFKLSLTMDNRAAKPRKGRQGLSYLSVLTSFFIVALVLFPLFWWSHELAAGVRQKENLGALAVWIMIAIAAASAGHAALSRSDGKRSIQSRLFHRAPKGKLGLGNAFRRLDGVEEAGSMPPARLENTLAYREPIPAVAKMESKAQLHQAIIGLPARRLNGVGADYLNRAARAGRVPKRKA